MEILGLKIDSLKPQDWFSLSMTSAFIVLFVVTSFLSRKVWLLADCAVHLFQAGVFLIRPDLPLSNISQTFEKNLDVDGVHIHLMRVVGVLMLARAVIVYRFSERDSDPTIFTSLAWSGMVALTLMALNFTYSYLSVSQSKSKSASATWQANDILIALGIILLVVEIVSAMIQLYCCPSWGGYPETFTSLNVHLRIDYFLTLICGITTFALPHWFLSFETTVEKPGATHLYLLRSIGIVYIGAAMLLGRAPNFLRDDDKVTVFEVRIVENMLVILLMVYAQNFYHVFTNWHVFLGMGGVVVVTINAALGYWSVKGYPKFKSN